MLASRLPYREPAVVRRAAGFDDGFQDERDWKEGCRRLRSIHGNTMGGLPGYL